MKHNKPLYPKVMNSRTLFSSPIRSCVWCALWLVLFGCTVQPETPPTVEREVGSNSPVSCDDALVYETADAHPAIRWINARKGVSANAALSCILRSDGDDGTLELKAYLSSGLYRFVRECGSGGKTVYRVFEYKNSARPYLFRLHRNEFVDPKTYIVVGSHRKPAGNYQHGIAEASNDASKISLCLPGAQ